MARLLKKMQAAGTTGSAGQTRPSLRGSLNVCSALSLGTGLIAPIARATRPVTARVTNELGASIGAPGPHGLNVRELPIVQRNST